MHEHGQLQRSGFVVDIAEEAAERESRHGLPGVEVYEREECRGNQDGPYRTHPVVQQSSEDHAPAQPLLEQRGENAHTYEVGPDDPGGHALQHLLQLLRHFGQQRGGDVEAEAGRQGGRHYKQAADQTAGPAVVAAVELYSRAAAGGYLASGACIHHGGNEHHRVGYQHGIVRSRLLSSGKRERQGDEVAENRADEQHQQKYEHLPDSRHIPVEIVEEFEVAAFPAALSVVRHGLFVEW